MRTDVEYEYQIEEYLYTDENDLKENIEAEVSAGWELVTMTNLGETVYLEKFDGSERVVHRLLITYRRKKDQPGGN